MKKLYILIFSFLWLFGLSQNPILFGKNWKIEKVIINNTTILAPNEAIGYFMKFQNNHLFSYESSICSLNSANANYSTTSQDFTITLLRHFPATCSSTIDVTDLDTNYSLFFTKNSSVLNKISYNIENVSTGYTLTLTNVSGDQVIYNFHTPSANLSSNSWTVVSLKINGTNYNKPPQHIGGNTTIDVNGALSANYFNTGSGSLGFYADNRFRLMNYAMTLIDSQDPEVRNFDNLYIGDFFKVNNSIILPYSYSITNNNETLIITKQNGDTATYNKNSLASSEVIKSKISIYPNPATEIVIVENLKPNSSLEIIDNSGKVVKSINNKTSKTEINIKNLPVGIYYLKVDGQSVQKIIKK